MRNFTTVATLARDGLIDRDEVEAQCAEGVIPGAFFDRITWQWWVPREAFSALARALVSSGAVARLPG